MLSAYDFRHMYDKGKLPKMKKTQVFKHTDYDNIKNSQEWKKIEKKLATIAETFLNNKDGKNYPPCFYIAIKYSENVSRLRTELFFKVKKAPGVYSFDSYTYCLEF